MQNEDMKQGAPAFAVTTSSYFHEGQRKVVMLGDPCRARAACPHAEGSVARAEFLRGVAAGSAALEFANLQVAPTIEWERLCHALANRLHDAHQALNFYAVQGFDHGKRARAALGVAA